MQVRFEHISKSFGGTEALHNVDFPAPFSPSKANI